MTRLLVAPKLIPPGEHLLTKVTLVWQHPGVLAALMDLKVGLGGDILVTELALVVPLSFVYHIDVRLQLHFGSQ